MWCISSECGTTESVQINNKTSQTLCKLHTELLYKTVNTHSLSRTVLEYCIAGNFQGIYI